VATTRELLLAERARVRGLAAALDREFAGIAAAASEPGTDDEHDPEGATLAFERQHTAALLARAREQIAEIDAAIGRLDEGTYGVCVRCGEPVGQGRLAARPAAATCVRCARLTLATRYIVMYSAASWQRIPARFRAFQRPAPPAATRTRVHDSGAST
jgi:DnaK suppressor protein